MSRLTAFLVLSGLVSACNDSGGGPFSTAVRDSAGIQIVQTAGNPWDAPVRWIASAEPAVRIGAVDGDEAYLFNQIGGIVVLSDGRVVVANAGDNTIRWYSPDGRFLFKRGGPGNGPGEFSHLGEISLSQGDTILGVDWSSRRFIAFGPDGGLGPTTRINGLIAPPGRIYRTGSGEWILGAGDGFSTGQLGGRPVPGVYRFDSPMLRISRDGVQVDTLGQFPSTEIEVRPDGAGTMILPATFGRRLHYALVKDEVLIATGDRLRFDFYAPSGRKVRSVRAPDVSVSLTPEIVAAYKDRLRERSAKASADQRTAVEHSIARMIFPESLPAYSSVIVATDDTLWVGEFRHDTGPAEQFLVFTTEGRFIGRASVPARVRTMGIKNGRVWGRTTDEFGVEYVVAYTLHEQQLR